MEPQGTDPQPSAGQLGPFALSAARGLRATRWSPALVPRAALMHWIQFPSGAETRIVAPRHSFLHHGSEQ